ncbi:MAG TPA: hypothetical protein VGS27_20975 [Candidatus Sulfotelmatobacter sp.]|nr:hypothetical protein [Candidatus Sulfotelmatobacter sp.]
MTRAHKIEALISVISALLLTLGVLALIHWERQKPITLQGAVIVADTDPRKQLPIGGVQIWADNPSRSAAKTDSSGFFQLSLPKPIHRGTPIVLHFQHPQYKSLDQHDYVGNQLYIVRMVPLGNNHAASDQPKTKVANVRVRYTVKASAELNVGSAVKTFEVQNKGNVPCKNQHPCSPDGRWKATMASATLDAGVGNQFRDARASCIAGPCPFTRIESDRSSQNGQILTLSVRDWSDTTTFLLEAEVFRPMVAQAEHWSYPAIFGDGFSFTLPSSAQSVSMEADIDGQTIIFPLGPALMMSWATCDEGTNPDQGRIFRCTLRPGYRFQ